MTIVKAKEIYLFETHGLVWDYGFGIGGLGSYLWLWNTLILFIPDDTSKKE